MAIQVEVLQHWRQGVLLDGRPTRPAEVKQLQQDTEHTQLELVLREGRNRQIRRVAEQLGHPVRDLLRVNIGRCSWVICPAATGAGCIQTNRRR